MRFLSGLKTRVQVMHAGYPRIDNMLALLGAHSQVYVRSSYLTLKLFRAFCV